MRVLVVEHDERDYERTRALLGSVGHATFAVDWVRDLQGGLERLSEAQFDVLLIDQSLPDGEGLELVRAAHSRQHQVPAVVLTGGATIELDLQAMALGAADFLDKDRIDASQLERSIRYALWRRRQAERLSHLAQHDGLTGLANRALFQDRLERALAWARRQDRLAAVMVLDLNGFKAVNDRLGHVAGDRLLKITARRLVQRLRETDTIARLGGDEFALIIENLAKPEHAALVARKVLDAIAPAVTIDEHEVSVTASLGVALYPKDAGEARALLSLADAAMYRAKAEGGNLCRFSSPQLERRVQRGALLESDLRRGLEAGEFVLHFQPQVNLAAREVGVSGLIRWNHPELGLIDAERFVPLAEESGLLQALTDWMIGAACGQLRRWREIGLDDVHLAVPLLVRQQLGRSDLPAVLRRALDEAALAPARLEIELSEELLLADAERGGAGVLALKELGVRVALDGFGRGPTSLRGLQLGVLDTLRLGRELLRNVPQDPHAGALLGAIIGLARELGLRVLAEGLDRQEQLAFLRARGCGAVQAFMSCPPLPVEACTGWLRGASARQARRRQADPPPLSRAAG